MLEEYISFLREETAPGRPYDFRWENVRIETFYLNLRGRTEGILETADGAPCTVSGTNEGGIVCSQWRALDA